MKRYLIGNKLVKASHVTKPSKKEEVETETVETPEVLKSPLDEKTVKELKAMAVELGIEIPKKAKKGDIIDLIEAAQDESSEL